MATAVGFDSPGAFARSFRAAVGETPSDYRRRIARTTRPAGAQRTTPAG